MDFVQALAILTSTSPYGIILEAVEDRETAQAIYQYWPKHERAQEIQAYAQQKVHALSMG